MLPHIYYDNVNYSDNSDFNEIKISFDQRESGLKA